MKIVRFVFSKVFLKNLLMFVFLLALLIVGANIYLNAYTDHGETLEVPELRGMTLEEVETLLEASSLQYEISDSVYSEGARGTVLEQLPPPQAKVKEDRIIYLTINSTKQPMKELKVKEGESFRIAQTKLKIDGIDYKTEYQPGICNDCVLKMMYNGKEIETGTQIRRGDQITLVLGERGNQKVTVPRLYGMSIDSAEKVLIDNSLTLGSLLYDNDIETKEDSLSAKIYDQHPDRSDDKELRIGSPVDVWLTTKPLETEQDTARQDQIEDPNLNTP